MKPFADNIYSTIFFNIASYQIKGHRLIAPQVGMLYENVEKLLREVSDAEWLKRLKYTNTLSIHIGYVMPENDWKQWDLLEPGVNPDYVLNDLRDSLQKYSMVYCDRYSKLDDVIEMIENTQWGSANYQLFERLPIMYYLSGCKHMGEVYINRTRTRNYPDANVLYTDTYIFNYLKLPELV